MFEEYELFDAGNFRIVYEGLHFHYNLSKFVWGLSNLMLLVLFLDIFNLFKE
jgi:hypothetical protein